MLYAMLMAPAANLLATKRTLLIVPDGVLYYLPFESLLTAEPSSCVETDYRKLPYLLKQWTVHYVPSASVLASLRQRPSRGETAKTLLAFGDPVYEIRPQTTDHQQRSTDNGRRTTGQRCEREAAELV
jgi:CHAT domain-containing protein